MTRLGGCLGVAEWLLQAGAAVGAEAALSWQPLHCAIDAGHAALVRFVHARGASLEAMTSTGHGAFCQASRDRASCATASVTTPSFSTPHQACFTSLPAGAISSCFSGSSPLRAGRSGWPMPHQRAVGTLSSSPRMLASSTPSVGSCSSGAKLATVRSPLRASQLSLDTPPPSPPPLPPLLPRSSSAVSSLAPQALRVLAQEGGV